VLAQLEGFEAPAALWEAELLPARVTDYSIAWLDELCTAGRTLWTRLRAPAAAADAGGGRGGGNGNLRAAPVMLLPRRHAAHWTALAPAPVEDGALSSRAQRVVDVLGVNGASFFDELLGGAGLLRVELEDALAELVARGRVHCDSFAGLRALLVPPSKRPSVKGRQRRRVALSGIEDAGRWAPARRAPVGDGPGAEALEHVARTLLRRYGVVCWRLLEREAPWLPPWRELLRVYRRLEARGEIRGGRFIAGLSGEQFALPEAIGLLRRIRHKPDSGEFVRVSAVDPVNLLGTVVPGAKVPRMPGSRVLYRDGVPMATLVSDQVEMLVALAPEEEVGVRRRLMREARASPEAPVAGAMAVLPGGGDSGMV
jgi:ATP-dependent Lhr-like helicase